MDKEDLIKKWLNNDLSDEEMQAFDDLDESDFYKKIIAEAQGFNGSIHAKVRPFENLESRLENSKPRKNNWLQTVLKIAAVFVIGMGIISVLLKDNINTFNTNYAQTETIILPDNSTVQLNEESELSYNDSKWDDKRALNLKGEALFEVEKGKRFDVKTEFGDVSVLGTKFNVISRDSIFRVSCYEGLVQVSYGNEVIKLPAGTEFLLKAGTANKTTIAIAEPYWLKKMSVFENASIDAVLAEIETQFNITIVRKFDTKNLKFTGAFEHTNLENAIKSITEPLGLSYDITDNKMVVISNENQ